jgi:hypothetical protein
MMLQQDIMMLEAAKSDHLVALLSVQILFYTEDGG